MVTQILYFFSGDTLRNRRAVLLFGLIFLSFRAQAQIPTNQDCLGAIPICGPVYTTLNSTYGTGNYPNEDGPGTCLSPGEWNSLWFIFTVITSGNLAFTIHPVTTSADYDWALYNLTGAACSDIPSNGSLLVSCNSSYHGITGISTAGTSNNEGPGQGNAFNKLLPVAAGQSYVLNVNNWSNSTGGYTINFGSSSATIFDSLKPYIDTIAPLLCNDSTVTFSFSENILCSSIQDADFAINGPGGNYTVSNITGMACSSGGRQETTFTGQVTPSLSYGGTYWLHLTSNSGGVEDLCGNISEPDSIPFSAKLIINYPGDTTICLGTEAILYVPITGGRAPYAISWSTGATENPLVFTPLFDTTLSVIATDSNGCPSDEVIYHVQVIQPPLINLGHDTTVCSGDVLHENIYQPGVLYQWQDGSLFYDYSITESGLYWVKAYNNCFESFDSIRIISDDCAACAHVPDAFTPNSDGVNDVFLPLMECSFLSYKLEIFNRWAQRLFFTEDPHIGWDGKYNGLYEEMGTYIWQLDYIDEQKLRHVIIGNVILLR